MVSNTKKSSNDDLQGAKPYDDDDPILQQWDGDYDFDRMLATIKKNLDEGKYK